MAHTFTKDPAAHLEWTFDWASWLGDDTITSATVATPTGLIETAETHDDTSVTVWLAGGDAGENYTVTCQISTAEGRVDERSLKIQVRER